MLLSKSLGLRGGSLSGGGGVDDPLIPSDGNQNVTGDFTVSGKYQAGDGDTPTPAYSFGADPNTGWYRSTEGTVNFSANSGNRAQFNDQGVGARGGSNNAGAPGFYIVDDTNTGLFNPASDALGVAAGGAEAARFDLSVTAGQTRFLLYDVDNATLERVTVGAADSGGAGFKVLRIPN